MVTHFCFSLQLHGTNGSKHIFMCLLAICLSSVVRCSDFLHIFNCIVCLSTVKFEESFVQFGYQAFIRCVL